MTHFTKGTEGRSPIDRVTGSLAFGASAEFVMVAAKKQDEDDKPGVRIFMRAKSNVGPDEGGFEYELQQAALYSNPDIVASHVVFGEAIEGRPTTCWPQPRPSRARTKTRIKPRHFARPQTS